MSDDDITLPRRTRGRRPQFFETPETDVLMSVVLAMAGELSVLYDRVDAMQRLLDRQGVLDAEALENFTPSPEDEAARAARRQEYMQRLFRVVRAEAAVFSSKDAEEVLESVERELSE
ncbi:MAG: hypothetical protein EA371_08440 [Gammaproteobacteria bacterium]|nr:MAG: hypothetical protein EA371_08440 [Gammaproteobacteria bacterium]